MLDRSKIAGKVILLVAALLIAVSFAQGADESQKITRTFKVKNGGTLTVDTQGGSITVITAKTNKVEVEISLRGGSWGRNYGTLDDMEFQFDQKGNDVIIIARRRGGWNRYWNNIRLKYEITIPEKFSVDLATAGGSIDVDDLDGKARVHTSGGSLHIGAVTGEVLGSTSGGSIRLKSCGASAELRTSGGSIKVGKIAGELKASTSGGSVNIDEVGGTVNVSTSGGSIHATITKQPKGDCSLKTSGGGITVYLDGKLRLNIDASSSGGGVKCDLPVTVRNLTSRRRLRGTLNGGGPELYLRSSGGTVRIFEM